MNICPVCGYPKLEEPPRSPSGGGSYEICPLCGFQFGVDDDDKGITFGQARERWVAAGMKWCSRGTAAPRGWNAEEQVAAMAGAKAKKRPAAKKSRR